MRTLLAKLALFLLGALLPLFADRAWLRVLTEFWYLLALGQAWNLLLGFGGLLSVGQQAYVGLGAYLLVALSLNLGLSPFAVVPLALLLGALVAWPASRLLFRLEGAYFAVGTWALAEVFKLLAVSLPALGGGTGTSLTRSLMGLDPEWRELGVYYGALLLGAGGSLLLALQGSRPLGLGLAALRDDPIAAESVGVPVQRLRLWAYVLASAWATAAGALIYIAKVRVTPDAAFSLEWTIVPLFSVLIGGLGTYWGPWVGTAIFLLLRQELAGLGSYYLVLLGALGILIAWVAPQGLLGRRGR